MAEQPDDEFEFARFLREGDAKLDAALEELGNEQPSSTTDAAILAQARAALSVSEQVAAASTATPATRQWPAALAVAATVVLTVGLVTLVPKQEQLLPMAPAKLDRFDAAPASPESAGAASKRPTPGRISPAKPSLEEAAPLVAPLNSAEPVGSPPATRSATMSKKSSQPVESAVSGSVEAEETADKERTESSRLNDQPADELFKRSRTNTNQEQEIQEEAKRKGVAAPGVMKLEAEGETLNRPEVPQSVVIDRDSKSQQRGRVFQRQLQLPSAIIETDADHRTPAVWLEEVRQLVAANRLEEARKLLHKFKKRYPEAVVPEDLQQLIIEP